MLLRGAVWFAEREGLARPEFRSRMNLSAWSQRDDSRETLEITRRGIERAQRLGLECGCYSLAGNAMDAALQLGEWDWIEATAAELRVEEQGIVWRTAPMEMLEIIAALRGDELRVDRAARIGSPRLTEGHDDPQLAASGLATRVFVAYARGDLETAARAIDQMTGRRPGTRRGPAAPRRLIGVATRDRDRLTWRALSAGRADAAATGHGGGRSARCLHGDRARLEAVDEAIDRIDATGHHLFAAHVPP